MGNSLYGAARYDGNFDNGKMFSLSFTPQLNIDSSEAGVILKWPTQIAGIDYTGFSLQSTTNLDSASAWSTDSFAPAVIHGQNTITHPLSEPQRFFRLKSP